MSDSRLHIAAAAIFLAMSCNSAIAGEADVIDVEASGSGTEFRFSVTMRHADTGWDHYADGWEVVGEDGSVYGKRVLHHPHVDEQPFTRSGTATIPEGVKNRYRARMTVWTATVVLK